MNISSISILSEYYLLSIVGVLLLSILFLFVLKKTSGVDKYFPKGNSTGYRILGFLLSCIIIVLFFIPGWVSFAGDLGVFGMLEFDSGKDSMYNVTQLLWKILDIQDSDFGFLAVKVDFDSIYKLLLVVYLPLIIAVVNSFVSLIKPVIGTFFYSGISLLIWIGACVYIGDEVSEYLTVELGPVFIVSCACVAVVLVVTLIESLVRFRKHANFLFAHLAMIVYFVLGECISKVIGLAGLEDRLEDNVTGGILLIGIPFLLVEILIYFLFMRTARNIKKKMTPVEIQPLSTTPVDKEDKEVVYCSNCGAKCKSYMKYCPNCGNEIHTQKEA